MHGSHQCTPKSDTTKMRTFGSLSPISPWQTSLNDHSVSILLQRGWVPNPVEWLWVVRISQKTGEVMLHNRQTKVAFSPGLESSALSHLLSRILASLIRFFNLGNIEVWSSLKFFLKFYQGQRLWGTLNTPILSPGNKNQDAMSQASLPFSKSVMYSPTFACVPGSPTGRNIFILFSVYRDLIS